MDNWNLPVKMDFEGMAGNDEWFVLFIGRSYDFESLVKHAALSEPEAVGGCEHVDLNFVVVLSDNCKVLLKQKFLCFDKWDIRYSAHNMDFFRSNTAFLKGKPICNICDLLSGFDYVFIECKGATVGEK